MLLKKIQKIIILKNKILENVKRLRISCEMRETENCGNLYYSTWSSRLCMRWLFCSFGKFLNPTHTSIK
jgi:hypothetical protein